MSVLPPDLKLGIDKALAHVPELTVLSINFDNPNGIWVVHFALQCDIGPNPYITKVTHWFAIVAPSYPFGEFDLYPAEEGGISVTFPHQSININLPGRPWRNGKICVRTNYAVWGKAGYDQEPFITAERFRWHIERAVLWIQKAAVNRLVEYGDPYELPDFISEKERIAFRETEQTFDFWSNKFNQAGTVGLARISGTRYLAVKNFVVRKDTLNYEWGTRISNLSESNSGIWILLQEIPIIRPWQTPITWNELFTAASNVGCDLRALLHKMYGKHASTSSFILFGFPIRERYGELDSRIHWQATLMPPLPTVNARPNTPAYYDIAFKKNFATNKKIDWLKTENWAKDQITGRGAMVNRAQTRKVLLIGCGAVGSLIAEQLVRLGLTDITVLDKDVLEVGNFSRHTLDMNYLDTAKARGLKSRLNALFPHVTAKCLLGSLEGLLEKDSELLNGYDVVIDATGSDFVLHTLETSLNPGSNIISAFTGYGAKRLYLYMTQDIIDLSDKLNSRVQPLLDRDMESHIPDEEPREGIGCWHPLFPARYDDLSTMVNAAISHIETFLDQGNADQPVTVFEIEKDANNKFKGLKTYPA